MTSEDSRLDKLIAQLKSNDVDIKVDALAKLQLEFEAGVEITDSEAIITAFKACLRISNQHLTSATLYALPPLLPLLIIRSVGQQSPSGVPTPSSSSGTGSGLIDVPTLRYALSSFLPSGGIIDRLGDRERPQAKAREALVLLGGYAFRAGGPSTAASKSGKGVETPLMIFERLMREGGLASKVWKLREQSILTLVHIRRSHPQFPIRPYLSQLVDCLEDTDAHVRDCARTSVVELFSGPGSTDAARADLKKEMTKKGVRRTIVESVVSKLMAAGTASSPASVDGSDAGDSNAKPKEYIPPSLRLAGNRSRLPSQGNGVSRATSVPNSKEPSRPASRGAAVVSPPPPPTPTTDNNADVQTVYIASARDLETEFAGMAKPFEGKETEHNWSQREAAIQRVRGMLKGDVHLRYPDAFFTCLKEGFMQWSLKTLASLRTTVAVNTCQMYSEMASLLGLAIDPYCDMLLTNLLKMAAFTKKITAQQSQASVTDIITHTSAPSRIILPLLWNTLQEKTVQARAFVVGHVKKYLEVHGARSKNNIEAAGGLEVLEKSVKKALADANPAVREASRLMFWSFHSVWPDNAMAIMNGLDGSAKKQLEKACPDPTYQGASETPQVPKKSSIAAAIAASRAKAKAIAAAPPSLRHQATSSSHTPATVRRSTSPSLSTSPKSSGFVRPSSPLRTASSPGSPPSSRIRPVATTTRSVSTNGLPSTHSRTPSGSSSQRAHSPSLSDQNSARRRTSSPLATTTTLRKAMQTALPASPPSSTGQASPPRRISGLGIKNGPVPIPNRQSLLLPSVGAFKDESLLLAQTVPIPEGDTDTEDDRSINLMSFSAAYEKGIRSPQALSLSPKSIGSRPTASVSNALSSGSLSDMVPGQIVVEDALRARAEQAESAAERLLELVDEDDLPPPMMPITMTKPRHSLGDGQATIKASQPKTKPAPLPFTTTASRSTAPVPVTPNNKASAILKQAALFKDSPTNAKRATSLLDVLQAKRHETGWWLKRMALFSKSSSSAQPKSEAELCEEIQNLVSPLERGEVSKEILQKIALVCVQNPVAESSSPGGKTPSSPSPFVTEQLPALHADVWEKDRTFDRLFTGLVKVLQPTRPEIELEYGLIVIWEMLEHQALYLEHREAELFSMLLNLRYCNKINVLEATSTIRDAITSKIDPVYGLTTFHSCLKAFHEEGHPDCSEVEVKAATYAFGLIALGKFILRLPAEIAEEELPRLKGTLIYALSDRSSLVVRESAAASIIAAQLVLRDEAHLFALLDGLADDKKNLLTYLFDKHGARDSQLEVGEGVNGGKPDGLAKFEKEILRLDTRTSTPSRVVGRR